MSATDCPDRAALADGDQCFEHYMDAKTQSDDTDSAPDETRAERAYTDVLAVEHDREAGIMRVVTLSDCYFVVPSEGQHLCPDREYNLDGEGRCKHLWACDATRQRIDAPTGWLVTDDLDERAGDAAADAETDAIAVTDGGRA